jgi:hypothetical protein
MRPNHRFILLLLLAVSCCYSSLYAQKNEFGIFLGGSYYIGDLNPYQQFKNTRPAAGLVYRKNMNYRYAMKYALNYGKLTASDAKSGDAAQKARNLNFMTNLWEATAQFEFNFFPFETSNWKTPATPFVFIGLSAFRFNPKANVNGSYVALRDLGTEGQGTAYYKRKKYSTIQPSIPFGIGLKSTLGKHIGVAFEWGMRKTFTDYIDDVSKTYVDPTILAAEKGPLAAQLSDRSNAGYISGTERQRGNSRNKDWYSFAGVTLTFKISDPRDPCPAY